MKQDTFCKIKCDYYCLLRMSMTTAVPRKHSSFDPRWHGGTSCIIILLHRQHILMVGILNTTQEKPLHSLYLE